MSPCAVTTRIAGSAHDFVLGAVADAGGTSARHSSGTRERRRIRFFNRTSPGKALVSGAVDVEIWPSPTEEERRAIIEALGVDEPVRPDAYRSRWRASGFDDLRHDATAEDSGGDPRVVEP